MLEEFKKIVKDCATSSSGDYDPARVVGYGVVVLGALEFLGLTLWTAITKGTFDGGQFAVGLAGISASLVAAAGGVYMKKSTEVETSSVVVDHGEKTATIEKETESK